MTKNDLINEYKARRLEHAEIKQKRDENQYTLDYLIANYWAEIAGTATEKRTTINGVEDVYKLRYDQAALDAEVAKAWAIADAARLRVQAAIYARESDE